MIKHVITMDKDDFETLKSLLTSLRYETRQLEPSHRQNEFNRYLNEIDELLGIDPPEIPEAVTARWRVWNDRELLRHVGYCTCCNNREEVHHGESLPTVCPNCKAVMTGVE